MLIKVKKLIGLNIEITFYIFLYMQFRLFIFLFCLSFTPAFAQKKLSGRVFEFQTRIALPDVFIENLNNKQSTITDSKGRFAIEAKNGDILTLKGFAYQHDTLLVINQDNKEIFLQPKSNQLAQVNITTTETKNFKTYYDPQFHGQTVVYHRNEKKQFDGGLTFRVWYWKKDERKKAKLAKKIKDFETIDKIAQIFTAKNISRYVPLTGEEMDNFIALYTPNLKTYTSNGFELVDYLNTCYKKYQALPPGKRKPEPLKTN